MQLEMEQTAFYKGWNYSWSYNLWFLQHIPQMFKKSEIVSITPKQYILKGIQDKNSVA